MTAAALLVGAAFTAALVVVPVVPVVAPVDTTRQLPNPPAVFTAKCSGIGGRGRYGFVNKGKDGFKKGDK